MNMLASKGENPFVPYAFSAVITYPFFNFFKDRQTRALTTIQTLNNEFHFKILCCGVPSERVIFELNLELLCLGTSTPMIGILQLAISLQLPV